MAVNFTVSEGKGYFSCDASNGSIGEMCGKDILRWVFANWSKNKKKIHLNTDYEKPFQEAFFKVEFITKGEFEALEKESI
jgi:hypothetical protein